MLQAEVERFRQALSVIREAFPKLQIEVCLDHPALDGSADIKRQPGLDFDVNLNLQDDELYLNAGSFCVSWFPCDENEVFERFVASVVGLLSGTHRIVEHRVGRWNVKAELQPPCDSGWETVATWATPLNLIPWWRSTTVLQNDAA